MKQILLILFISSIYTLEPNPTPNGNEYKITTSTSLFEVYVEAAKKGIKPGDVFEFQKGTHSDTQYMGSITGTEENPIIIRGVEGAVIASPTTFHLERPTHVRIENLEIKQTEGVGLNIFAGNNIVISGLKIHHTKLGGMKVAGKNILVTGNHLYECSQGNYELNSSSTYGPSISTESADGYRAFSENIIIEKNYINNSWGEAIDLLNCDNCAARNNTIINAYPSLIYVDNSQNCLVERNIGYQNDGRFTKKDTYGIRIATGTGYHNVINITIRDNLILNTNYGFSYYFTRGHYDKIHLVHNVFYNTTKEGFKMVKTNESSQITENEVSNNVFYGLFSAFDNATDKTKWTAYSNAWFGGNNSKAINPLVDSKGYENSSIVMKEHTPQGIVYDSNYSYFDPKKYIPKEGDQILYKKGIRSSSGARSDYFGVKRNIFTPTIGFAESAGFIEISMIGVICFLALLF